MKLIYLITLFSYFNAFGQLSNKTNPEAPALKVEIEQDKLNLRDTSVNFMWTIMKYDSAYNSFYSESFLNLDYLERITDQERAAIGYVSTFVGYDCWWEGDLVNDERSNLDCKIISALGLGYQCSESHLGYLRKWFSNDSEVLSELHNSNCPIIPYTASEQNYFSTIKVSTKEDSISVYYEATGLHMRAHKTWDWSETVYFIATNNSLKLIKKDRVVGKHEEFRITE